MSSRFVQFLKGKLLGGKILETLGAVEGSRQGLVGTTVRVHRIEGKHGQLISLELVAKSFLSYQMFAVALDPNEARRLATLVQQAADTPRYRAGGQ